MKNKTLKLGILVLGVALIYSFNVKKIINKKIPSKGKLVYSVVERDKEGKKKELKASYYYDGNSKGCTEFTIMDTYSKVINNFKDTTAQFCVNVLGSKMVLKSKWNINGDIKFINKTKLVKGFLCKKATIKMGSGIDGLNDIELWYDPKSDFQGGIYGGVLGLNHLIFEAKFKLDSDEITCELSEIKKNTDKSIFEVSESDVMLNVDLSKIKNMMSNFKIEKNEKE